MNYDKIGIFIQQKRKEKNMTQKDLAEKIGVTDRAISKWERGHGCPDVSILEILSNELECSVLELLKGRKIENEVIPVTEADDYVRNSLQISSSITKNKIVSMLNKVIITSIIFVALLLTYLNIVQIGYTSKKHTMEISLTTNKNIVENEKIIEDNLKIIRENQGKYSDEDYAFIVQKLEEMLDNIKGRKIYKYIKNREDIIFTVNDVLIFSAMEDIAVIEIAVLDRLMEYTDEQLLKYYRSIVTNGWTSSIISVSYLKPYTSYEYLINPYGEKSNYSSNEDFYSVISKMKYEISRLACFTEVVKKVGEIHE